MYHIINIEKGILSAILFNPEIFETIDLTPNDFYSEQHKQIFRAMQELEKSDEPISEDFLKKELGNNFNEEAIIEIVATNPITNIQPYIEEIRKSAIKRDLINKINNLSKYDNVDDIKREIYKLSDNLKKHKTKLLEISDNYNTIGEDTHFYIKDFLPIPHKTITMITASGGGGKSNLTLQICIKFLLENRDKNVFLWYSEDPKGLTKKRIYKIFNLLKLSKEDIKSVNDRLKYSDSASFHCIEKDNRHNYTTSPKFYEMKSILNNFDLIVLDPLIGFFGGDENSNSEARQFMQLFTEWTSTENKTIIFIHHSSKNKENGNNSRGASAFVDAIRLAYGVENIKENTTHREIKILKDNYNSVGASIKVNNKFFDVKKSSYKIQVFEKDINIINEVQITTYKNQEIKEKQAKIEIPNINMDGDNDANKPVEHPDELF